MGDCLDVFASGLRAGDRRLFFSAFENQDKKRTLESLGRIHEHSLLSALRFIPSAAEAARGLPPHAHFIRIEFTLARNLVTRDDPSYYPTDNTIRRDHVFKVPMISGASWKGAIRAAAAECLLERNARKHDDATTAAERLRLWQIFGDEKDNEGGLGQYLDKECGTEAFGKLKEERLRRGPDEIHTEGRLRCLPTFFDRIAQDVLNPRRRDTRAGSVPITLEVVPAKTVGVLCMVYFPFDLIGGPEETVHESSARDWELVASAITRVLSVSGVGGKKTSGFGVCDVNIKLNTTRKLKLKDLAQEPLVPKASK
jgi:CRISPR-associated protein Cmr2